MRGDSGLTTTSYALLGQLALRPWSVYDMAKNVGRTLHWFWPRAESIIYAETKRLAQRGLAAAEDAPGRRGRRRLVYSITPRGQSALAQWLGTPSAGFSLHAEPLLRVHLAPYGTRDDLIRALDAARLDAERLLRQALVIGAEFSDQRHQFQHQVHTRAILFDYLWNLGLLTYLWAERSLERVRDWPDLELRADTELEALELIRESILAAPVGLRNPSAR